MKIKPYKPRLYPGVPSPGLIMPLALIIGAALVITMWVTSAQKADYINQPIHATRDSAS